MDLIKAKEIFEINGNYSDTELKSKYKKLARKYHPDKGGDVKKFQDLKIAYDVLLTNNFKTNHFNFENLEYEHYLSRNNIDINKPWYNETLFRKKFEENKPPKVKIGGGYKKKETIINNFDDIF